MARSRHRRRVCYETARELYFGHEQRPYRAKHRVANRITGGRTRQADMPTRAEVQREMERLIERFEPSAESTFDPWYQFQCIYGEANESDAEEMSAGSLDRFVLYQSLLQPLEQIKSRRNGRGEADLLHHSLQVFDAAVEAVPYDEELLTAALLHEVGWAIDRIDPVAATLEALAGNITPRCHWLIAMLPGGLAVLDKTIGHRAHRRLAEHEDYEDLLILAEADRSGHQTTTATTSLEEALEVLVALDAE